MRAAILINPSNPSYGHEWQNAKEAARTLREELLPVEVRAPGEIDSAFARVRRGASMPLSSWPIHSFLEGRAGSRFSQRATNFGRFIASANMSRLVG